MFYIIAEDFIRVLIGPFPEQNQAEEHVRLCEQSGDDATHRIVTMEQIVRDPAIRNSWAALISPKADHLRTRS